MTLSELRKKIDTLDGTLIALISQRISISREVALIKKKEKLPILDAAREKELIQNVRSQAEQLGLSPEIIEEIFQILLKYSRLEQELDP